MLPHSTRSAPPVGPGGATSARGPRLGRRYAANWDGPRENRVYVQNAGRASHGIADPQLALLAWRSAAILNDALGRRAFALDDDGALIEWSRNGDQS